MTVEADVEATEGPDLQSGIRINDIVDGGMIAGHVGNDPVVLVRNGDEFFALDAHCTHYGAPLTEGVVMSGTIRCPWHHACFSFRTGSASDRINLRLRATVDRIHRTAPLKGLWAHAKGGFYHDGRFATYREVVDHYNTHFALGLTEPEKVDLIEYLKSL